MFLGRRDWVCRVLKWVEILGAESRDRSVTVVLAVAGHMWTAT